MMPTRITLNKKGWQCMQNIFAAFLTAYITMHGDELLQAHMMAELAAPAHKKITAAIAKLHDNKQASITLTPGQACMLLFFRYQLPPDDEYAAVTLLKVTETIEKALLQPAPAT